MNETIITALTSGAIGALVSLLGNTLIIKSNNIKDRKSKELIACSIVEDLICMLGNIKIININAYNEYFAIFESIENLESYMNSIRQINRYRFHLPQDILSEIGRVEDILREIAANYYTNLGNDEYSLINEGVECHVKVLAFKKSIRNLLDKRYRKLK